MLLNRHGKVKHAHRACSVRQQPSSIKFPEADEFVRWCDGVGTEGEGNQPTARPLAHRLHQGGSTDGGEGYYSSHPSPCPTPHFPKGHGRPERGDSCANMPY